MYLEKVRKYTLSATDYKWYYLNEIESTPWKRYSIFYEVVCPIGIVFTVILCSNNLSKKTFLEVFQVFILAHHSSAPLIIRPSE